MGEGVDIKIFVDNNNIKITVVQFIRDMGKDDFERDDVGIFYADNKEFYISSFVPPNEEGEKPDDQKEGILFLHRLHYVPLKIKT